MLEFGTELVAAEDRSLVALLGASPGASTRAYIAIGVLQKCFPDELTYGINLTRDGDARRRIRAETTAVLKIENL